MLQAAYVTEGQICQDRALSLFSGCRIHFDAASAKAKAFDALLEFGRQMKEKYRLRMDLYDDIRAKVPITST